VSEINLQALYARHRQALFTLALARTGRRELAEDAVHDAFVRLCRGGLSRTADPVAYAFAAVRNAAVDKVRRVRLVDAGTQELPVSIFDEHARDPEQRAAMAEQQKLIAGAVNDLGPDEREAMVLRIYADLSFAQIAQVMGTPVQTACSRYYRALRRLREQLERFV